MWYLIDLINFAENKKKSSDKWFEFNIKEILYKILLTILYEPFQFTNHPSNVYIISPFTFLGYQSDFHKKRIKRLFLYILVRFRI